MTMSMSASSDPPPTEYVEYVSAQLRAERAARNLTQTQVAKAAGVDRQSLNRYETGKREPNITVLQSIVAALGVPIQVFFQRVEERRGVGVETRSHNGRHDDPPAGLVAAEF